jgi:capsular exopolysaccharide synthesis family protein
MYLLEETVPGPVIAQSAAAECRPDIVSEVRPSSRPAAEAERARALSARLVVSEDVPQATIEQYARLAASLHQAQAEQGLKTVMLASALPREGKTLTAANLALTLSESYRQRVLLVDTDLRGASLHGLFGIPMGPGLGDFLDERIARLPIVAVSEMLSVLPAGQSTENPVAGLVSDRMKLLVQSAAEQFDWVLLDTGPLALLSDANLVARLTDGVVIVIAAGSTPYPMVQRAIAAVGPERILGVVLNRAAPSTLPQNAYYSGYYNGRPRRLQA